jgi:RimJ/RimL family protein N-acetyltransferase
MTSFNPKFCFPVPSSIENERLRLVPFDPSRHSSSFVQSVSPHPELFDYLPFGPFPSRDTFDPWFEETVFKSRSNIAFAIFDKTRPEHGHHHHHEAFAGMTGLLNASPQHLSTELGYLIIFPNFQRTHVSSNAVGLLLNWVLNSPGDLVDPGLGLRRAYWSANTLNTRSIALAQRLGMKLEAIMRWDRVLPAQRSAFSRQEQPREGDPRRECPGRDTARLAICWDDWMNSGKEDAARVMNRVI